MNIYKVLLANSDNKLCTMTIEDRHLKYWNKTIEDLRKVAMRNTSRLLPYKVEVLDDVSKVDSDLYILPASIHEVIVVSTDIGDPEDLKEMVEFVNSEEVAPEEQLSDNIYRYDHKNKTVSLVV